MVVYVWTAFLIVFYAANLPFCLLLDVDTGRETAVVAGVGVFLPPRHLNPPGFPRIGRRDAKAPRGALLRAALVLLRRIRFHGDFALCAGDAAATALISGAVLTLTLGHVRVFPDFSTGPLRVRFRGMVSVKPGHIMLAALAWAQEVISGRISTWKSMRLRAL